MLCSVCLKPSQESDCVASCMGLANVLQKYFSFKISLDSEQWKTCRNCYDTIMAFEAFAQQIEEAHRTIEVALPTPSGQLRPDNSTVFHPQTVYIKTECDYMSEVGAIVTEEATVCDSPDASIVKEEPDALDTSDAETVDRKLPSAHEIDSFIQQACKLHCGVCKQECGDFGSLERHSEAEHKRKAFIFCCGRKFSGRDRLYDHARLHQCEICRRIYASRYSVKNHMLSKHKPTEKKFKCTECGKSFTNDVRLKQHQRSHVSVKDRGYRCDTCNRSFATIFTLRYHVHEQHKEAWRYMCEACGKGFYRKHMFDCHVAEHSDGTSDVVKYNDHERVSCEICHKIMKRMSLRKHMAGHFDSNAPYRCDICGKESPSKGAHLEHIRFFHKLEKIHECTVCEKSFKKALTLKEHMAVHTGQPLFSCPYCSRTFKDKSNFYSHRKKSHHEQWKQDRLAASGGKVEKGVTAVTRATLSVQ